MTLSIIMKALTFITLTASVISLAVYFWLRKPNIGKQTEAEQQEFQKNQDYLTSAILLLLAGSILIISYLSFQLMDVTDMFQSHLNLMRKELSEK